MLLRKDIEPRCAYCVNSVRISDEESLCSRKGVVKAAHKCRAFAYDPFSRIPPKLPTLDKSAVRDSDFELD